MFYKKISMIFNLVMKRLCVLLNGTTDYYYYYFFFLQEINRLTPSIVNG